MPRPSRGNPGRQRALPGGELERSLLAALWAREQATVRELYEEVGVPRGIVYTTVAKVLDRLVEKGMVKRRRTGRAHTFQAVAERDETQRAMARGVIRKLAESGPLPAVAALVGALEDVSPELVRTLEAELRARKRRRHGP
jgi:predicted transcriptional regulator